MTAHLATLCRDVLGYTDYHECHKAVGFPPAPACRCKLSRRRRRAAARPENRGMIFPPCTGLHDDAGASLVDLPRVVLDALCHDAAFVLVELGPGRCP